VFSAALTEAILKDLRDAEAFYGLQKCLCSQDLVERKVAEVLTKPILWFDLEWRVRRTVIGLAEWRPTHEKGARMLRTTDPHMAGILREMADWFPQHRLVKDDDPTASLTRQASHLDFMTVDVTAVIWFATRASSTSILTSSLPPILERFAKSYAALVPRRGLANPEMRFKRFLSRQKTTNEPPLRGASMKAAPSRDDLLVSRAVTLFAGDTRFPPDLLLTPRFGTALLSYTQKVGTNRPR
jgi:hypothetical protein